MNTETLSLLIVEDDPGHIAAITRAFRATGRNIAIQTAGSLRAYRESMVAARPDLVLMDLNLPDGRALEVLSSPPEDGPAPYLVMTSHGDEQVAVEALKAGAMDYIVKSPEAFVVLPFAVDRALREWKLLQDRKRADLLLAEQNDLLSAMYESSPVITMLVDRESRVRKVNSAAVIYVDSSFAALPDDRCGDALRCVHALDAPAGCGHGPFCDHCELRLALLDTFATTQSRRNIDISMRLMVRDAIQEVCFALSTTMMRVNRETLVLVCLLDITDRKRAEMKLTASNDRITQILNSTAEGIFGVDVAGNCTFCNPACVKGLGCDSERDLLGRNMHDLVHAVGQNGPVCDCNACAFHSAVRDMLPHHRTHDIFRRFDGQGFPVEYWSYPILQNGRVTGTVVSFVDRTEHLALESQLLHAQKMEGIGTLAGGIAHDFNNILTTIVGYGHLTIMGMPQDEPLRSNIYSILEASDRAASLVRNLLAFSRKHAINRKPVDVNTMLGRIEDFLGRIIGEDVEIRVALDGGGHTIFADHALLEQVFMNLATNARDAMPKGGVFTITTAVELPERELLLQQNCEHFGAYIVITAADTGTGMSEETKQKIFDPFFTTKEVGKGTGLGLAMAYGIVRQHGGFIRVRTEAGRGAAFLIYLPLIESAVAETTLPAAEPLHRGTETILLAEDDPSSRNLTKTILEQMGYRVIVAADGVDAVMQFIRFQADIQLFLSDIIMPKMNGLDACREIRKMKPDLKTVFVSGYSAEHLKGKLPLEEGVRILYKPIWPPALLKTIREILVT